MALPFLSCPVTALSNNRPSLIVSPSPEPEKRLYSSHVTPLSNNSPSLVTPPSPAPQKLLLPFAKHQSMIHNLDTFSISLTATISDNSNRSKKTSPLFLQVQPKNMRNTVAFRKALEKMQRLRNQSQQEESSTKEEAKAPLPSAPAATGASPPLRKQHAPAVAGINKTFSAGADQDSLKSLLTSVPHHHHHSGSRRRRRLPRTLSCEQIINDDSIDDNAEDLSAIRVAAQHRRVLSEASLLLLV